MKFDVYFLLRGPARTLEVPNNTNPVECANLTSLMDRLAYMLPNQAALGIETIGIRIEPAEERTR